MDELVEATATNFNDPFATWQVPTDLVTAFTVRPGTFAG